MKSDISKFGNYSKTDQMIQIQIWSVYYVW